MGSESQKTVWTVGHSRHTIDEFLSILHDSEIQVLVDVRTSPFSKMSPQFNRFELNSTFEQTEITYLFMGDLLGGRPADESMYFSDGHVHYDLMAKSESFNAGLERLIKGINNFRVAIMCSEGEPSKCHRTLLIGRVLQMHSIRVLNILTSGKVVELEDLNAPLEQQSLFNPEEVRSWKSAVSVRQESQHEISLDY